MRCIGCWLADWLTGANLVPHFTTATPRPKKPTQKDRFRKHANKLRCKCTRVKTARRRRIPTTQPPPRAIVRAKCASVDDTDTAQRGLRKICRDGRRRAEKKNGPHAASNHPAVGDEDDDFNDSDRSRHRRRRRSNAAPRSAQIRRGGEFSGPSDRRTNATHHEREENI